MVLPWAESEYEAADATYNQRQIQTPINTFGADFGSITDFV